MSVGGLVEFSGSAIPPNVNGTSTDTVCRKALPSISMLTLGNAIDAGGNGYL
jgi:hypothetical protein